MHAYSMFWSNPILFSFHVYLLIYSNDLLQLAKNILVCDVTRKSTLYTEK